MLLFAVACEEKLSMTRLIFRKPLRGFEQIINYFYGQVAAANDAHWLKAFSLGIKIFDVHFLRPLIRVRAKNLIANKFIS